MATDCTDYKYAFNTPAECLAQERKPVETEQTLGAASTAAAAEETTAYGTSCSTGHRKISSITIRSDAFKFNVPAGLDPSVVERVNELEERIACSLSETELIALKSKLDRIGLAERKKIKAPISNIRHIWEKLFKMGREISDLGEMPKFSYDEKVEKKVYREYQRKVHPDKCHDHPTLAQSLSSSANDLHTLLGEVADEVKNIGTPSEDPEKDKLEDSKIPALAAAELSKKDALLILEYGDYKREKPAAFTFRGRISRLTLKSSKRAALFQAYKEKQLKGAS